MQLISHTYFVGGAECASGKMASAEYSVIKSHIADINRRIPITDLSSYAFDLLQADLVSQVGHDNPVAATGRGIQDKIASLTSEALGKINISPHLFSALVAVIEKRDKEFACILRKEYQGKNKQLEINPAPLCLFSVCRLVCRHQARSRSE